MSSQFPKVIGYNKFSYETRKRNIDNALSHGFPDIDVLFNANEGKQAIIIGGGPSANAELKNIKKLISKGKSKVIAIDRMYKWCLDNKIIPDYVVAMDASEDVVDSFKVTHPHTKHILSLQCDPKVFEMLDNVYVFTSPQEDMGKIEGITLLDVGSSVTIGCFNVAVFLGMENIHLFGFDCHIDNGEYAKGISGEGSIKDKVKVEIAGREFTTTLGFITFTQQLFEHYDMGKSCGLIKSLKVYGDTMAGAMVR